MLGLLAAAIAAIAVTTNEPAFDIPNGETCKTLLAVESFTSDPTYLTPYEKCYLDRWHADEEHGVFHNKIWVRIKGQLFSLNKTAIRTLRNDQAKEVFEREVRRQYNEWKAQQ